MVVHGDDLSEALTLFNLTLPFSRDQLEERYQELRTMWHPHRYASLSNNPRKYMALYRRGEAMTKELAKAHAVLWSWLEAHQEDVSR